ncbi:hypothetical protein [uncultured Flavobacterium sp.]|uniref:hypothetical protein n=1 Tax=uncultured Flavobacterium sp. TaxID=165435 RepID=UPI00263A3244|nr:hypothetical protein [uncultured Flavobacterium sp.]
MKLFTFNLFLFLLLNNFSAFSQDQECIIYFKDGTALEGFGMLKIVNILDPKEKIKFRLTKEEKGDFWDFEDISKITFIGFEMTKTFEYVKTSKYEYPKLLEILVDGEVKLYRSPETMTYRLYFENYNVNKNNFPNTNTPKTNVQNNYLKRDNEEIATCIDCSIIKSWAKNVSNYLSDCTTLVDDLKNYKYTFAELEDAIIFYNDYCTE